MAPLITLYILAGCVAAAAVLFIIMIVITALRPPQLPDISFKPEPPLQRMMRALTPVPIAAPPVRPPVQVPAAPPVVRPKPPAARPSQPIARPSQPVARPSQPIARATPRPSRPSTARVAPIPATVRRPVYPVKQSRPLLRVLAWVLVTTSLAACAAITNPMLLDPLCDDYEWFGADTAQVARQYARDAHDAIASFIHSW